MTDAAKVQLFNSNQANWKWKQKWAKTQFLFPNKSIFVSFYTYLTAGCFCVSTTTNLVSVSFACVVKEF